MKLFRDEKEKLFSKEKFRQEVFATGNGIDSKIIQILHNTNRLPFAYTFYQSCSGLPSDHNGSTDTNHLKADCYNFNGEYVADQDWKLTGHLFLRYCNQHINFKRFVRHVRQINNSIVQRVSKQPGGFSKNTLDPIGVGSMLIQLRFGSEAEGILQWTKYGKAVKICLDKPWEYHPIPNYEY